METNIKFLCHCGHYAQAYCSDIHGIATVDGKETKDLCDECFSVFEGKESNGGLSHLQFKDQSEQDRFVKISDDMFQKVNKAIENCHNPKPLNSGL